MSTLNVKDSSGNWKEIPSIGGYTKDEVNTMIAGKANSSHTHTLSQITDFAKKMTFTEIGRNTGNSSTTLTLSQSILNFDLLIIKARDNYDYWYPAGILPSFTYTDHLDNKYRILMTTDNHYIEYYFTSTTALHINGGNRNLVIVYGVNIG